MDQRSIDRTAQSPRLPSFLTDEQIAAWRRDLDARLQRVVSHPEQNAGFLEEHIRRATQELQCLALAAALQAKADQTPCQCHDCHGPLKDQRKLKRTIHAAFGSASFTRTCGFCSPCQKWCYPADYALGLERSASASPLVQELAALLVTKMPAEQAEPVARRLGLQISRATLDREARRQGGKAEQIRATERERFDDWEGIQKQAAQLQKEPASNPFTLVIEIDAWNIRERDDWGQTEAKRQKAETISRWHWVYVATCFRLDHRGQSASGRPFITQRRYAATRLGVDGLMRQLYVQAVASGLWQAERVLVVADGAVWIWNAVADRFPKARQRLDLFHADEHIWEVAKDLHGQGTPAARAFVAPLLAHIREDQTVQVIQSREQLKPSLLEAQQENFEKTVQHLRNNQHRMKYKQVLDAQKELRRKNAKATPEQILAASEPVGSGAIESTCRQYQCRFKRTGQFWTRIGDEALLCLETFWRNEQWETLYPHAALTSPKENQLVDIL